MTTFAERRFKAWFDKTDWWREDSARDSLLEAYLALGGGVPDRHEAIIKAMETIIATIRSEYGE